MKAKLILLVVGLVFVVGSLYAASGYVIISSTTDKLNRGTVIGESQSILLKADQTLKLLSLSGKVIELVGPYHGPIESDGGVSDDGLLESLSKVVKSASSTDLTLAVFRNKSLAEEPIRGDIWGVEIGKSGNFCVPSESPVILWWPDPVQGVAVTITDVTNSKSFVLQWSSRRKESFWPKTAAVLEASPYTSKIELSNKSREFTLSRIPGDLRNDIERIVWMAKQHCETQAIRLLGKVINQ